ncbi:putative S-adenosyl-L-methionine-dependent methyltransferase [Cinnamomum micranthum f. kanehirae]|uniref:Putative S-adenosyl-L-methionine-dependent methyltransferase n=1 Tax=Cinnamomum micranthum f. kanehirae TaxID=337451 RepID=A0A443PHK7_9MAGN|nr:putative S-adenosyl-L-methionine-dependent methyltransferase [Cinnamomum micranthum f. kanehirae]
MATTTEEEEGSPRNQQRNNHIRSNLKILLLLVSTNLLTFYIFTSPSSSFFNFSQYTKHFSAVRSEDDANSLLLKDLNATRARLLTTESKLATANTLLSALLSELNRFNDTTSTSSEGNADDHLTTELKLSLGPQKLPLGRNPNSGSDEIYPPVGAACRQFQDELNRYMTYDVGGKCPSDNTLAQRLMLKGCEPLPRRRCHPKSPAGYIEPVPLPASLWSTPPDTSIVWDPYTCKSYKCLIDRKTRREFKDCKDCFDLEGREKQRWLATRGVDYGIDDVLATKPPGTVRIGLDIGGGTGTFAARMRERNVTVVTSTMNLDGPFNSFVAARGLVPVHVSVAQRLPFFEGTLDIVHSMHVLSNWIPDMVLEFALYDVYRVLRPGGIFWLDRFFCLGSQLNETYVPMIQRVGFKKVRWDVGRKLDRGIEMDEWYLSALLERPMT